jgi:hypothetical protein
MSFRQKLEARLRRWAVSNPTAILIAGQVLFYLLAHVGNDQVGRFDIMGLLLLPGRVLEGEVWRLFTFLFYPPATTPVFVIFFWLLMYRFGTALEAIWGTYRYNIYLLIAYFATIIVSFVIWSIGGDSAVMFAQFSAIGLSHGAIDVTGFIYGTLFLAFARLFPDYTINVMFILPVRIKWLALLAWIGYGFAFLAGNWAVKLIIAASLTNYALFLGREHIRDWKQGHRRRSFQARAAKVGKPIHKCLVCGIDSENSPKTAFRYCSKCAGQCGYCPEHIQNHEHVASEAEVAQE